MTVVCISAYSSAPGALRVTAAVGRKDHHGVGRQAGHLVMTAAWPPVSITLVGKLSMSISSRVGSSRSRKNSSIAVQVEDFALGNSAPLPPLPPVVGNQIYVGNLLYVGNLSRSVHSRELAEFFEDVADVERTEVISDSETRKSKGFAFVTMSTLEDSRRAIKRLDGCVSKF